MAKKKKSTAKSKSPAPRKPSLNDLTKRLVGQDQILLAALNERARLAQQVSEHPDYDPTRDHVFDVPASLFSSSDGPLPDTCVRAVFRELTSGIRSLTQSLRVAYLGPEYSYSHLAAVQRFGTGVELAPVATIAAVFHELNRGHANYGLVPIENSTDGRVADTLDMFARLPARICGEVQLWIHHNLLGKCRRAEIREVYSKPQALSQCRDWLATHLPHARPIEMTSTAAAAQLAADKPGAAAIASLQAAVNYGLDVIASSIEDNKHNITRFAVIGGPTPPASGDDKTSVMFELDHHPGALADAMTIFKRHKLNLTWIESFPMPDTKNEYLFFVEFEGHECLANVQKCLASLAKETVRIELLGSYARQGLATGG